MRISKITLENFRIYKGATTIEFPFDIKRNITVLSGKNGYGKTTFLTSLIWGLYGKQMALVEEKYRKDIKNLGGYDHYLRSLLNKHVLQDFNHDGDIRPHFAVEIVLVDVLIPSIPCKEVIIRREFNYEDKQEQLTILIDGAENELTKEVGYEVFVNDFILPREIAKFFFFDAEKIVTLAEAKSKNELRTLSRAYSEVLGIKKYEDLKQNLLALLTKLRRKGIQGVSKDELNQLIQKESELEGLLDLNTEKKNNLDLEIKNLRDQIDVIQEKLIREGSEITLEELKKLKSEKEALSKKHHLIKNELKKLMDIIPFVIAYNSFNKLTNQLIQEQELKSSEANTALVNKKLSELESSFLGELESLELASKILADIKRIYHEQSHQVAFKEKSKKVKVLLDYDDATTRRIIALKDYINNSFKKQFDQIVLDDKRVRSDINSINRKIRQAESKKGNSLIQKLHEDKKELEENLDQLIIKKTYLIEESGALSTKFASHRKVLSEYEKKYILAEVDQKKYEVTQELLEKIEQLIERIKVEKKHSLEKTILLGLNKLLHKEDFIHHIEVKIENDIMDIDLIDPQGNVIDKDSLSKGEQQLYATSLLKALVDESGINFPVFIDSPLQKFDKQHSKNVIKEFYPTISDQVVLFPLLEKELSKVEFDQLLPNVNSTFLIENSNNGSILVRHEPKELFKHFNKQQDVLAY